MKTTMTILTVAAMICFCLAVAPTYGQTYQYVEIGQPTSNYGSAGTNYRGSNGGSYSSAYGAGSNAGSYRGTYGNGSNGGAYTGTYGNGGSNGGTYAGSYGGGSNGGGYQRSYSAPAYQSTYQPRYQPVYEAQPVYQTTYSPVYSTSPSFSYSQMGTGFGSYGTGSVCIGGVCY